MYRSLVLDLYELIHEMQTKEKDRVFVPPIAWTHDDITMMQDRTTKKMISEK